MDYNSCRVIEFPKIGDRRGNLSYIEENNHIPFKVMRSYWIYDVPGGERHSGHAYYESQELIIALSGSFDVTIDTGKERKTYSLNRSYYGLYIPSLTWREICNFSTNSLALIVSSTKYNPNDYIRDYQQFRSLLDEK